MNNYLKIIKINDNRILYNYSSLDFKIVKENLVDILNSFIKFGKIEHKLYDESIIKDFMDLYINNINIFRRKLHSQEVDYDDKLIFSFPTIHSCNLRCKYCFADSGENFKSDASKEISNHMVKQIFKYIMNSYSDKNFYRLEFVSGGEPLLNQKNLIDSIDYALKIFDNKNFEIVLVTNGTLLNQAIVDFIQKRRINLAITINGSESIHNNLCIMKNGKSAYGLILNNLKLFNSDYIKKIWSISIVTSDCISIKDIILHNYNIGIRRMEFRIARGSEKNTIFLNERNINKFLNLYIELIEFFISEIKNNRLEYLLTILNDYDYFGKLIKRIFLKKIVISRCGAAVNKISFTSTGDIYPCDSFVGKEEFILGNVNNYDIKADIINAFKKDNTLVNECCKECKYNLICGGDCYYNRFVNNNSIYNNNTTFCQLNKKLIDLAIEFVLYIYVENVEIYKKILYFLNAEERINNGKYKKL